MVIQKACAALRISFSHREFFQSLGFIEYEKAISFHDAGACFEVIPICLNNIDHELIKEKYFSHISLLNKQNICIKSNLLEII